MKNYTLLRKYIEIRNAPIKYSVKFLVAISVVVGIVCIGFLWGRTFGWYKEGYVVDNEVWGNLGDFVGGMFGPLLTFITIFFMWWTITEQQAQMKKSNRLTARLQKRQERIDNENRQIQEAFENEIQARQEAMAEMQRFNDLFFSMLELYNSRVNDLRVSLPMSGFSYSDASFSSALALKEYTGKEFFSALMRKMKEDSKIRERYSTSKSDASRAFGTIYNRYSIELSVYFRTVYRIFDFIFQSEIPEKEKVRYVKIMRAQLTRGELFFLHYNASSRIGARMSEYVVMYRLTKHLPIFDHLEFKWLTSRFKRDPQEKIEGLNIALYQITEKIIDIIQGRISLTGNSYFIDDSTRYKIQIIHPVPSVISIVLRVYPKRHNMLKELKGFVDFKEEEFHWMLKNFLRCVFRDTSFNILNPNIRISKPKSVSSLLAYDNYTAHTAVAWNPDGEPLILTHPYWD